MLGKMPGTVTAVQAFDHQPLLGRAWELDCRVPPRPGSSLMKLCVLVSSGCCYDCYRCWCLNQHRQILLLFRRSGVPKSVSLS